MNVLVMRHGTTVWNEKGITQGRTNNRLSKVGVETTTKRSEEYKNVKLDVIYCSPLMRTVQTANIMNRVHHVKVIKDVKLIEIDQGIFTGRSKDDLSEEEKLLKYNRDESCGMESYNSVYNRCKEFVSNLKDCSYDNILIITHNCNATLLENVLLDVEVDFNNDKQLRNFSNAEIKCFKI
jgi:probable phosphoglycerate mutase